jgi:hypothetical protein
MDSGLRSTTCTEKRRYSVSGTAVCVWTPPLRLCAKRAGAATVEIQFGHEPDDRSESWAKSQTQGQREPSQKTPNLTNRTWRTSLGVQTHRWFRRSRSRSCLHLGEGGGYRLLELDLLPSARARRSMRETEKHRGSRRLLGARIGEGDDAHPSLLQRGWEGIKRS